ncbi:hypothetical protein, unknown function [Leishmania braziliensis MHOM/BR/75/M2904]|uniref:F-box domain-containing protein n=2 Tax=Leishmania braziliensis TaxID=5660 RepID=A4HPM8_LEIBR|nr:hypothetical protein, unknown function [Leishmania braziliensis MHOM/BR/75/M2904]CAJ2481710.1 unnamed protein product [Leishmania braziliensis]CAJ2482113.1 unnamed protein product [Leishmania braziliensis]CAM44136.1 hypothetical protein, unknown function [Leishmania braziliensis MHOM/BR/75/M2904]SYZ70208.1 hypothetical_protein [Leishmania braziliensis MHOM/BR/75/M2904]
MDCADTLLLIAAYLTKKELIALSEVSQLCRKTVNNSFISYEEKQYLLWPCLKEEHVELAPPSQILALGVLEKEQRLLVLVRSGTDTSNIDEIECYLYTQLVDRNGCLVEHQKELPACFAFPSSLVHFGGNRYLLCKTREGDLHVFDCLIETMIEVPVGTDGFYASPGGDHFLLDYNRHVFFCTANAHIACRWEMTRVDLKRHGCVYSTASNLPPSTLVATHLRAQIVPLPDPFSSCSSSTSGSPATRADATHPVPPLHFYLGTSSAAWRTFWMGSSSALCANEDGVSLLKVTFREMIAERLTSLSSSCLDLVHSSCGDVYGTPCEDHDEYAVMSCREVRLHTVSYWPGRRSTTEVRVVDLDAIVPSRTAIKSVRIIVSRVTYLIHMQHQGLDRMLLLSSDLTLTRWISIGRPSCYVLWRQQVSLVTASLPDGGGESFHPLVEAVEGGLGCVYTFGMRLPDVSSTVATDPFATAVKVTSVVDDDASPASVSRLLVLPQSLTGVEALSWMAFGIVSASLLWTVSALCYNGWWLHLQLLLWEKVA